MTHAILTPPAVLVGTPLEMVVGFHNMYEVPISVVPSLRIEDLGMRIDLLHEEFVTELIPKGLDKRDPFETADAIADFIWVTYSLALSTGIRVKNITLPRIFSLPVVTHETIYLANTPINRAIYLIAELKADAAANDIDAFQKKLDELLDLSVELAVIFQVDLKYVLEEVAISNASKLMPDGSVLRNAKGKVLKGPNFQQPKLARAFSNAVNPEKP